MEMYHVSTLYYYIIEQIIGINLAKNKYRPFTLLQEFAEIFDSSMTIPVAAFSCGLWSQKPRTLNLPLIVLTVHP